MTMTTSDKATDGRAEDVFAACFAVQHATMGILAVIDDEPVVKH